MYLILLPWILTIVLLFAIMVWRIKNSLRADDSDMDEEHHEIIRVAVHADHAYWVHDNILYHAETSPEPDFTTARPVDTMALTESEMSELFEILDELEAHDKEQ